VNWGQIRHEEILYANFDISSGAEYISYLSHNLLTDLDWNDGFYGKIATVYKCEDWTGTTWNDQYVSIYNYDAVFQLSEIMTEKLGGVFTNYSKDIFEYDINGNLQIHIHRMYDMVNGILLAPDEVEQYNFGMYTHNSDETVISAAISLSVYPNPFNDVVTINLQNKSNAPIETSIYNIKGQLVRNLGSSRNSFITWDGKDNKNLLVGNGIYFIRAEQDGRAVSKKVIRMR
ncbi:MAG: T9SS type A sorting domain-containing protein, partial [Candidatus Cloacimonadaceae bacterium]